MVFGGFQKLTLLDYPEKTACTLFTIGCNYACPFCQNASLISDPDGIAVREKHGDSAGDSYADSVVLGFLKTRKGLLDGVCISGGEPLIRDDLEGFINDVKALGFSVKLDTNGSYPQKLEKLIKSGKIDYVAMDIKNSPEKYAMTVGLPEYDIAPINESIDLLLSGTVDYEFRTTVVREFHTADDLISVARRISGAKKYFLQKFMKSENVLKKSLTGYSDDEMHKLLSEVTKILPLTELRGV